jgi:hypothetical protein
MAGYSGTPLVQKLGIRANHHVALVNSGLRFVFRLKDRPRKKK